jgi:hypothetical protein
MCNNIESFDSLFIKTSFLLGVIERIKPVKVYSNFKEDRLQIIKDQQNKSGFYCLLNLIIGHTYIGSSTNLQVRICNYLNNLFLKNKKNMNIPLVKAL